MMPLADCAQVAIARKHLATTWRRHLLRFDGILFPERDGGNQDDLDISTTPLRIAQRRYEHRVLLFLYVHSRNDQSR